MNKIKILFYFAILVVELIHNVKLLRSIGCRHCRRDNRKAGLNKSFSDAGLSQFVEILSFKAEKAGLKVIKVDPRGTSQHCSQCLNRVPKGLSDRWNCCYHCGVMLDRDVNSAILIQKVGMGIASLKNAQPGNTGSRSQRCTA